MLGVQYEKNLIYPNISQAAAGDDRPFRTP